MTIKIYSDRIDIGDFTLFEGNGGLQFDGVARAENFKGGAGTFQGSVSGYTSGGFLTPTVVSNVIDKFPFATDTNATDVGDLTQARQSTAGQSSETNGYTSGGGTPSPFPGVDTIDKFPFATNTNATDVGNLTRTLFFGASGQSSFTHGYTSGGYYSPTPPVSIASNTIDKFSFFADANATDVGDITQARYSMAGQSSSTHGYSSGGTPTFPFAPGIKNTIDKFPFTTDTNATDVGDLTGEKHQAAGQSSTTHGYTSGGVTNNPIGPGTGKINVIDKFPFAADTNATDVGDLTDARSDATGQSSVSSGYTSGGNLIPGLVNTIDKFPFATDTNATDVGNLTEVKRDSAGQQS